MRRLAAFVLGLLLSAQAQANDATHCIELGESKEDKSRTLKNTCGSEVMVFWCHHGDRKGTLDSACNAEKKFFRQQRPLKSEEIKSNRYSLPPNTEITYGACFGSYGSFTLLDGEGRYFCNPMRLPASGSERRLVHTHVGDSVDEACAEALSAARAYGRASECVCETRSRVSVCRVESTGKGMGDPTGLQKLNARAKEALKEATKCDPAAEPDCRPRRRSGGMAIRG